MIRERDERAREAHSHDAHVTLAPAYDEWREGAAQTLANCNKILEDRETFEIHLDRRPGAEDELRGLSARIASDLEEDDAEIQRRRQQQDQRKLDRQKQEQQKQEQQEEERRKQERRQSMTRGRGGLSM